MKPYEWGIVVAQQLRKLSPQDIELINLTLKEHGFVIVNHVGVQNPQTNLPCFACGYPKTAPGMRHCNLCLDIRAAEAYKMQLERRLG